VDRDGPNGPETLAKHWSGQTWSTQTTPDQNAPAPAQLNSVSCSSATACTAVGDYIDSVGYPEPVAERWNGDAWSVQIPQSPGASGGELSGVSCTSADACMAVGTSGTGLTALPIIEQWDGTNWTILPGFAGVQPSDVSCSSANACTTVGSPSGGSGMGPAERWNGETWVNQSVPTPGDASEPTLSGVSCSSETACTAIGGLLAEGWDGTAWSIQMTPAFAPGTYESLGSVSCVSADSCMAVGGGVGLPGLAERWDGSHWTGQSLPPIRSKGGGGLNAVSCSSSTSCTAVGYSISPTGAIADVWDGARWTAQSLTLPTVSGPEDTVALNSVSCPSPSVCIAVGGADKNGNAGPSPPIAIRSS
jgi:hypothetical protein